MALAIRRDRTPASLRMWARRANNPRAASRAYAIAHALEGLSRAEAARLAGMERQALRDAVVRYNAEGVSGLSDRPRIRPSRLTEGQQATLRALILRGPNPDRDGVSSWTRAEHRGSDRGSVGPSLPRLKPEQDLARTGVLATKDATVASQRRPEGPRGLAQKRWCPLPSPGRRRHIRTSGLRCISRMKPDSARKGAAAAAGGCAASGQPVPSISATPSPMCSPPSNPRPVGISAWCFPPSPPRR